jgi:hypothetical protein
MFATCLETHLTSLAFKGNAMTLTGAARHAREKSASLRTSNL